MKKKITALLLAVITSVSIMTPYNVQAKPITDEQAKEIYKDVAYDANYPLRGKLRYNITTKEDIDELLNNGGMYFINGEKVTATKNRQLAYSKVGEISLLDDYDVCNGYAGTYTNVVLLDLAGLNKKPLNEEEQFVRNKVLEYMNSYDWKNASEYDKTLQTLTYISKHIAYDNTNGDIKQNEYSVLVNGAGVCSGFAVVYNLLAKSVGLNTMLATNGKHDWNHTQIDSKWYSIDSTNFQKIEGLHMETIPKRLDMYISQQNTNEKLSKVLNISHANYTVDELYKFGTKPYFYKY